MTTEIREHYERHAVAFDNARSTAFVEQNWLERFLIGVPRKGHVVDVGCGSGEPMARYLIDGGYRVTGIDFTAKMIALARTRFPRETWHHADMRTFTLDAEFHGALAWDCLFHLEPDDQVIVLEKVARALRPGAPFLFNTGASAGQVIGRQFGEALYHASLAPAEYRACLKAFQLEEIAFKPNDPLTGDRSIWLARKR